MIYPKNIIGPRFDSGDIITFTFDEADLTLRSLKVPNNRHNVDQVSQVKDFQGVDTRKWDLNDQAYPCVQLLEQRWCFEDGRSLDDIAQCSLYVSAVEAPQEHVQKNSLLSTRSFENLMLSWLDFSFAENEKPHPSSSTSEQPTRFDLRVIEKGHLPWLCARVHFVPESPACPIAMIPVNHRFVLIVSLELESLHYAGRTNPYSKDLLKQFEQELFEDFLSHVRVDYSPETIRIIQDLKDKSLV